MDFWRHSYSCSPPQFGQCSKSSSNTRLSSLAQLSRTGRWCAQFASHSAGYAAWAAGSGPCGTTIASSLALGASTPWKRIRCSLGQGTRASATLPGHTAVVTATTSTRRDAGQQSIATVSSWLAPGRPLRHRKLTSAGRTQALAVSFLARPRTHTSGQQQPFDLREATPRSWPTAGISATRIERRLSDPLPTPGRSSRTASSSSTAGRYALGQSLAIESESE